MKKTNEKFNRKLLARAEGFNDSLWAVVRRLTIANSDFARELEALPKAFDNLNDTERAFERIHLIQEKQTRLSAELKRLSAAAGPELKKLDKRTRQLGREPLSL